MRSKKGEIKTLKLFFGAVGLSFVHSVIKRFNSETGIEYE